MDAENLRLLIRGGETSTVEFKIASPHMAELAERICGFANSLGGILIISAKDKVWGIVGIKSISEMIDGLLQNKFLELFRGTESQELLMLYQDVCFL